MTELPAATLRLFDGYAPEDLTQPEYRDFLLERLLEDGDRKDLRWLARHVSEDALREFFRREAGRRLSARSRAFWRLALEGELAGAAAAEATAEASSRSEIWPLA